MKRTIAAGLTGLALAGCQQAGTTQGDAPVSVLPGSASDAMLPLDTVTSLPPLDPRAVRGPKEEASGPAVAETDAADGDVAPVAAAPPAGPVAGPAE